MKKYRFSKTYVGAFFYRFAFLLFVPLLQGFLFAKEGWQLLFTLYSTDLLVITFLLSFAVIRCNKSKLLHSRIYTDVKSGVLLKTEEKTLKTKRCSFVFVRGIFLRLFGGCRLRIYSGNGFSTAYIKNVDKKDILKDLLGEKISKNINSGIFRSLLMSASFSNALTGLLAAVPLIRRGSMIIGAHQTALLVEGASLEGILKFTGLPPLLSRVSVIIFFCWIIGFSNEFFGEYGLSFKKYSDFFMVSKGLITKTQAVFSQNSIRGLVFRQSLLMFLLGFYSAEIKLNIKPRQRIHILSAARATACTDLQEEIYGKVFGNSKVYYPPKTAMLSYTYLPVMCFLLSSLTLILFSENIIIKALASVFSGIFAIWFLFRFFALFRSSLTVSAGFFQVKYFSGMNFTRIIFKAEDVVNFEITQSLFQIINGRCNVYFKVANAKAMKVRIKHLNIKDALKIKEADPQFK